MQKKIDILVSILFITGLLTVNLFSEGCRPHRIKGGNKLPEKEVPISSSVKARIRITFISPKEITTFQIRHAITYELIAGDSLHRPDSVVIYLDGKRLQSYNDYHIVGSLNTGINHVGIHTLRAIAYLKGKKARSKSVRITLVSDFIPRQFTYRVIKTYPHDRNAYTQGLLYEDGYIYEGTGLRGESTLRKWDLETGKIIESLNLPPDLFGEGICILGDNLYQLTWTSRIGFVYDKKTFSLKNKIRYVTQGWGLTTDGEYLIMSDGSNALYFLEPKYFTVIKRIEVYDDRGPVNMLNELEYIDHSIYANVFQTDDIVQIDPESGKVLARINLRGILPRKEYRSDTDVLNGIAWDAEGKRIFVTGKRWPELFEVQFIPIH